MSIFYRQMSFSRLDGDSLRFTTGWSPERVKGKKIKVGNFVSFKEPGEIWRVDSIGEARLTEKQAKKQERYWLHYREATDI